MLTISSPYGQMLQTFVHAKEYQKTRFRLFDHQNHTYTQYFDSLTPLFNAFESLTPESPPIPTTQMPNISIVDSIEQLHRERAQKQKQSIENIMRLYSVVLQQRQGRQPRKMNTPCVSKSIRQDLLPQTLGNTDQCSQSRGCISISLSLQGENEKSEEKAKIQDVFQIPSQQLNDRKKEDCSHLNQRQQQETMIESQAQKQNEFTQETQESISKEQVEKDQNIQNQPISQLVANISLPKQNKFIEQHSQPEQNLENTTNAKKKERKERGCC